MHPSQAAAWAPWAGRSAWLCVCRMRLWHPAVAVGLALGSCQALENGVGRTPMMGWMAWVRFRCNINCVEDPENCISEKLFMGIADTMVRDGWRDAGYEYVSLDDCWQSSERAADGSIQPNATRFPSGMKALGDYIHARGLKLGLYTAMGAESCMGYPALGCRSVDDCEHAQRDVQTYVSWGVDYIKVDTCRNGSGKVFGGARNYNTTHPLVSSWFLEYGRAAGRPVLYHPSGISLRDGSLAIDGGISPRYVSV